MNSGQFIYIYAVDYRNNSAGCIKLACRRIFFSYGRSNFIRYYIVWIFPDANLFVRIKCHRAENNNHNRCRYGFYAELYNKMSKAAATL